MSRVRALRPTRGTWVGLALLGAVLVLAGSACGSADHAEPTLPTVNFTPKVVVTLSDHHVVMSKGAREDGAISFGGPGATPDGTFPGGPTEATVPAGTVIEIVNAGTGSHRLQGDIVFDTGTLARGDRTTVVLTNDGTSDKRIVLSDPTDPGVNGAITVHPKPNASS